jgi:hypothetical protein
VFTYGGGAEWYFTQVAERAQAYLICVAKVAMRPTYN